MDSLLYNPVPPWPTLVGGLSNGQQPCGGGSLASSEADICYVTKDCVFPLPEVASWIEISTMLNFL